MSGASVMSVMSATSVASGTSKRSTRNPVRAPHPDHRGGTNHTSASVFTRATLCGAQQAVMPPSMTSTWPVMKAAASLARKSAPPAISSGWP